MSGCLGALIGLILAPFKLGWVVIKGIFVDLPLAFLKGIFHGLTLGIFDTSKPRRRRSSSRGLFGSTYQERYRHMRRLGYDPQRARRSAKSGCYVATAVYGSYDCPEVWTLRRYRDNKLASTWYGRAFIRTYYAISPTMVKLFGNASWFQKIGRILLEFHVHRLNDKGFESTPYVDKEW